MLIILIIVGILLIVFNVIAILKGKHSFKGILSSTENNMGETDIKIGELRREFSESLLDIQKDIEKLQLLFESRDNNLNSKMFSTNAQESEKVNDYLNIEENLDDNNIMHEQIINVDHGKDQSYALEELVSKNDNSNNNSTKVQEIERLLSEGNSLEDISDKLGIGKGEILLIKELYLK